MGKTMNSLLLSEYLKYLLVLSGAGGSRRFGEAKATGAQGKALRTPTGEARGAAAACLRKVRFTKKDGNVNVRDCAYIAKILASQKVNRLPMCSDYNKDGENNIRDAASIAKELASKVK